MECSWDLLGGSQASKASKIIMGFVLSDPRFDEFWGW